MNQFECGYEHANTVALIDRLMADNARQAAQIDKLIDALMANQPVEVIRAMNPPAPPASQLVIPWADDAGPEDPPPDPWSDPNVTNEQLITSAGIGWVNPNQSMMTEATTEQENPE